MRLQINMELERPELPRDYRSGFMSLIKAALAKADGRLFRKMYDKKTLKPFTFSVYFPEMEGINGDHLQVGTRALLNFSTIDPILLAHVYNGLREQKDFLWGSHNRFTVHQIRMLPQARIETSTCTFKTLSPFLVNLKGHHLQYLSTGDKGFDDGFKHSIRLLCQHFLGRSCDDMKYEIINSRKMVVFHYGQPMTCNKAVIVMQADAEILNLLYDVGIGVRRNQGFGMLEIIK